VPSAGEPVAALPGAPAAAADMDPAAGGLLSADGVAGPVLPAGAVTGVPVLDPPVPLPSDVVDVLSPTVDASEIWVDEVDLSVAPLPLTSAFTCVVVVDTALETLVTALPVITFSGAEVAMLGDDEDTEAAAAAGGAGARGVTGTGALSPTVEAWASAAGKRDAAARAWWTWRWGTGGG